MQNTIFYNQPSYQIFDKQFDDPNDALFQLLNEVKGNLMCQEGGDDLVTANDQLTDPRNHQLVQQTFYDYTKPKKWVIFQSPCESNLYRSTQEKCLRVLIALTNHKTLNENDLDVWQRTLHKYQKEEKRFHQHVKEFVQHNKELIYEGMQQLVTIYKTRYKQKIDELLPHLPDVKYLTHIGLPHVRLCKSLGDQTANIKEVKIIESFGDVMLWLKKDKANKSSVDKYTSIYHRLNRFVLPSKDSTYVDAKKKIETLEEKHTFVLPLESLLFLLTAGDYMDLPTEMLLEMTEKEQYKCVEFQLPLPSKDCGWHTNSEILECALHTYESLSIRNKWLLVINQSSNPQKEYKQPEIDGRLKADTIPYKLHKIDETNRMENPPTTNINKSNHAFVSWQLQTSDTTTEEETFHVITKLKIPAILDTNGKEKLLGCHLIKVEHKTQFGCEIMTKYELIKAWLQLTLFQSDMGQCTRLDLKDFRIVLEQNLTLEYLEQQLSKHYQVDMPHLLSNLHEFLKLLLQVNAGNYLLRFKSNHPDNFLLCSPTEIDSPNAVHLKRLLLNNVPSEFSFLMKADYLPIAQDICGPMHLANKCLPCAFPPNFFSTNRRNNKSPISILSNERKAILNKVQIRRKESKKLKQKHKRKKAKKKKNKTNESQEIKEDDIMIL